MQLNFKVGIGDRVRIAARGDVRGKVKGLFVGEDGRHQVSVAYVDSDGDPVGPEWFGEDELAVSSISRGDPPTSKVPLNSQRS